MSDDANTRLRRALSDSDVERWHANLAERSLLTADIYARRLDRFCEEFKTTSKTLWSLDSKSAYNFLIDAVRVYRNRKPTARLHHEISRGWSLRAGQEIFLLSRR